MRRFLYFITTIFLFLIIILFYLSIFGFQTKKFNQSFSDKLKENYPSLNLELDKIYILFKPLSFSVELKTKKAKIKASKVKININEISTDYNIIAFLKKEFGIKNVNLILEENKIEDIIIFFRAIQDSPQLFISQKIVKRGTAILKAKLHFDNNGNIKNNFEITGRIKDLSLRLLNEEKLENINTKFKITDRGLQTQNIKLNYLGLEVLSKEIAVNKKKGFYDISGSFRNKSSDLPDKIIKPFFKKKIFENIIFSSENTFSLNISKKYKISNLKLKSKIILDDASFIFEAKNLKNIIPDYNDSTKFKNHEINFEYDQDLKLSGKGNYVINNKEDKIFYDLTTTKDKITTNINVIINKIPLKIDLLNYTKEENIKSELKFNILNFKNKTNIKNFSFTSQNASFIGKEIILDKNYKINRFNQIKLNFKNSKNLNNDLIIKKKKNQYNIFGDSFALDNLIKEQISGDENSNFPLFDKTQKNFNFKIKKAFIDKEHNLLNINGDFKILKNKIIDLDLKSSFSDEKAVSLTIRKSNDSIITTFYSELAKPFVKKIKFIKGFEEGQIDFSSTKKADESTSSLKIYDFKLKELPALTKVLTLASLQGISDLLTGEGVRFDEFEMIFSNKDKIMKIDEIYAIGPAISILMEGYIQKDELVSLKGTLVPATTINKFVASIPILGEILVGKKTGEGVFGVSFKIKGSPKDLKTTVNPIKTLTPRFITRTLEKIKKSN